MRLPAAQFGRVVGGARRVMRACRAAWDGPADRQSTGARGLTQCGRARRSDLARPPRLLRTKLVERDRQITALEEARALAEAKPALPGAIIAALQRYRFEARSDRLDPDQLQLALEQIVAVVTRVQAGLDAVTDKPSQDRAEDLLLRSRKRLKSPMKPS